MDYNDMTTEELKKMLITEMKKRYSSDYMLGWLEMSYLQGVDDSIERAVAIKQLKGFQMECDK